VVQVVRRSPIAHEDDPLTGRSVRCQRHLGHDLGAAKLALQPGRWPVMQNTQPTAQPTCVDTPGRRAAAARFPPQSRRPAATSSRAEPSAPAVFRLQPRQRGQFLAQRGSAVARVCGRKSSSRRRRLSCASACATAAARAPRGRARRPGRAGAGGCVDGDEGRCHGASMAGDEARTAAAAPPLS